MRARARVCVCGFYSFICETFSNEAFLSVKFSNANKITLKNESERSPLLLKITIAVYSSYALCSCAFVCMR